MLKIRYKADVLSFEMLVTTYFFHNMSRTNKIKINNKKKYNVQTSLSYCFRWSTVLIRSHCSLSSHGHIEAREIFRKFAGIVNNNTTNA